MAITYEWRHYDSLATPGAWLPTVFLNDGAINDLHTTASGALDPGGRGGFDWQSPNLLAFTHILEARLTSDTPLSVGSVTFCLVAGGNRDDVVVNTYQIFGTRVGIEVLIGSGTITSGVVFNADVIDGLYDKLRLAFTYELDSVVGVVPTQISITDFRYVFVLLPVIVSGTEGKFRFRMRNGPGDTTTLWGPYIDTTALVDGPPPGSPGHPDHSTHCNMGQPTPPVPPHSDVQTSFGSPVILDLEGDIILPGALSLNRMSFSSLAGWNGTIPAVCTYEVEVFTAAEDLILIASGTTLQNAFTDLEFDIDPSLAVTLVRVTLHQERTSTGQPQIALDLYDISVFEATCTLPSAPIDLVVTSHRDFSNPSAAIVDMTWGAPLTGDTPIEYFVYRVKEGTEVIDILVHVTTDLFSSITTLSLDQNHCFYIVAKNDCGVGPPSLIVCTEVSSVVLGPTNFRDVGHCEGDKISLLWDLPPDVGGIGGFHVYRDGLLMANLANTASTWVDMAPGIEVLHTYELRTIDLSGAEIGDMTLTLENVFACEWMDCTTENEAVEGEWTQILV
jgi:hypothetical protein